MGRFVRPDTTILKISNGDTLTVKRRLTSGEQRATFARMYLATASGEYKVNPLEVGMALVVAYLIDWSLTDDAGGVVPIRGLSAVELTAVLDMLSPEDFAEVRTAIEDHDAAMRADLEEKKTILTGANGSGPISDSPSPLDGLSSTSAISIPMSTRN